MRTKAASLDQIIAQRVHEAECDMAYKHLVYRMARVLGELETMGDNQMGNLRFKQAMRFHSITGKLRGLVDDLMKEVKPLSPEAREKQK